MAESLVAVGFGILGLTSLIYSLLFLVAQWAFSSLSPRLNLFRDDPIVWRTYGLAIGILRVLAHGDARGSRPPTRASAAPRCECASRDCLQ